MQLSYARVSRKRRRSLYVIVIVVVGLALLFLAMIVPGNGAKLISGPRPMFTEWRPGDRGPSYRRNLVRDAKRRYFLFDSELNTAVLVIPSGDSRSVFVEANDQLATIRSLEGESWQIKRDVNALHVAFGDGEIRTFAIPPGFIKQVAKSIPYPEGTFDGDVGSLLMRHPDSNVREDLESLLGG